MTVVTKNTYHDTSDIQQRRLFSAHRRYDGARPVYNKTMGITASASKVFRKDILGLVILFMLVLFIAVLLFDLASLSSGKAANRHLSSRIDSLSSSIVRLQEDLTIAMNHPVLRNADSYEEAATVITLTAGLP